MTIASNVSKISNLIASINFICMINGSANPTMQEVARIMREQQCNIRQYK